MNNAVLITAAGTSQRFGKKKEYLSFSGRQHASVLSQSVYTFAASLLFNHILITVPHNHIETVSALLKTDHRLQQILSDISVQVSIIEGSDTRQNSVHTGLEYLAVASQPELPAYIFVHDGARPWISEALIKRLMDSVNRYDAVVPAVTVVDTQKEIDKTGKIVRHLMRENIAAIQTPQAFFFSKLLDAHRSASNDGKNYTDDSEIYASYIHPVYTCTGERDNKKITYPEDLENC